MDVMALFHRSFATRNSLGVRESKRAKARRGKTMIFGARLIDLRRKLAGLPLRILSVGMV